MTPIADARYALRLLARSPIFAITSIVSLALGIAASTAIFSLADALLFKPATGIHAPSEVVDIGRSVDGAGFDNMSHPIFTYLQAHATTLQSMSAVEFGGNSMSLVDNGASERVTGTLVSSTYFDVLQTRPAVGRFFLPDEDRVANERPVVVLSYAFWQRRLGGDPDVLQKPLRLNGQNFAVVGVAERGFEGLTFVGTDMWIPMAMVGVVRGRGAGDLTNPGASWHMAVGRLKPGSGPREAEAELNTLIDAYKAEEPRVNKGHGVVVASTGRVPPPVRLPFTAFIGLLFLLTGALMAIACSNVAGMLLARAAARRREMATRLAVGASSGRLIAQLLVETLILFVAASVVALPLTMWLTSGLESFLPALPFAINLDLSINPRIALFSLSLSLVTAVVFGLAPARQAIAGSLTTALHGAYATADRRRLRARHALVIAQVALSIMLVVTATLFVRTLQNVADADPGYVFDDVYLASVDVSVAGYQDQAVTEVYDRFLDRLGRISGVRSVAVGRMIPLQGGSLGLGRINVPGYANERGTDVLDADWNVISPRFFETVGLRLVEGRDFTAADRVDRPLVAIVNETFARTAWPGRPAIGQHFLQEAGRDQPGNPVEVVGVAADAKYRYFSDPATPFVYVPLAQQPLADTTFFVKHEPGRSPARDIRVAVAQVEPTIPVIVASTFEEATSIGLIPQKVAAWIAGGVGATGLFLAALGLYGLMAFIVAQRTREIAIRMALGASSGEMQAMVLRQAARLGALGAVTGLGLAGGVAMLTRTLLVGIAPIDPVSFVGTAIVFALVLAAACWNPARRAAATEPAAALRAE